MPRSAKYSFLKTSNKSKIIERMTDDIMIPPSLPPSLPPSIAPSIAPYLSPSYTPSDTPLDTQSDSKSDMPLFGFVKEGEYTKNNDGTFTCTLNTVTNLFEQKPQTITANFIGILNNNNIQSPNSTNQIIIMSSDNKYIFIQNDRMYDNSSMMLLSIIIYTIKMYNISIPDLLNIIFLILEASNYIPNDVTWINMTDGQEKELYKYYLLGLNPTDNLLSVNSNKKIWSDIGYIFNVLYVNIIHISFPNFCVNIDSPNVLPNADLIDCRNNQLASDIVLIPTYTPTYTPTTQPPTTQSPTTQPPTTQPLTTQPPTTQQPTTQPPTTQPPTTQPLTTQPPTTQPPRTQPPTTKPLTTQQPTTQPPTTQPLITQPPQTESPSITTYKIIILIILVVGIFIIFRSKSKN